MLSTSQQIGQALGLATVINVVAWFEARGLTAGLDASAARVGGYRAGFMVEAGFAALALLITLTVIRSSPRPSAPPTTPVLLH